MKKVKILCCAAIVTLTSVSGVSAFTTDDYIKKNNHGMNQIQWDNVLNDSTEYVREPSASGYREFVNTIDLNPYIEKYGLDKTYKLSFDGYAEKSGWVSFYLNSGNGSTYDFVKINNEKKFSSGSGWSTSWSHHEYFVKFSKRWCDTAYMDTSHLAFYGIYGTGIIPHVKNIKLEVCK